MPDKRKQLKYDTKARMEDLNREMQAVSADLYAQPQTQQPDGASEPEAAGEQHPPGGRKNDEADVIDADFEEVNK